MVVPELKLDDAPPDLDGGGAGDGEDDIIKITVNVLRRHFEGLEEVADDFGDTRTDVINRAIYLYTLVMRMEPGMQMAWKNPDGSDHSLVRLS
jgi:hypothetical protein